MDQINTNYIIPSPPSSLSTNTLSHDCLSVDTPTSKGTISMEPYPIGGYDFAFYEEELLSTLTIRPKSQLQPNTTYTITVNNELGKARKFWTFRPIFSRRNSLLKIDKVKVNVLHIRLKVTT